MLLSTMWLLCFQIAPREIVLKPVPEFMRSDFRSGSVSSVLACPFHVRSLGHSGMAVAVGDIAGDVIQAPKPEPRIMRYELTDCEWNIIKPLR